MAGAEFSAAPEVEEIAKKLIEEIKDHVHLADARIAYLFRSGEWSSQKRETQGCAQRVTGPNAFLLRLDFMIIVHKDVWPQLTEAQQVAMVDHELCHCKLIEGKWCIVGHDVEEHYTVVERHGLWRPQLEQLHESMGASTGEQLPLLRRVENENGVPTFEANQAGLDRALDQVLGRTGTEG